MGLSTVNPQIGSDSAAMPLPALDGLKMLMMMCVFIVRCLELFLCGKRDSTKEAAIATKNTKLVVHHKSGFDAYLVAKPIVVVPLHVWHPA